MFHDLSAGTLEKGPELSLHSWFMFITVCNAILHEGCVADYYSMDTVCSNLILKCDIRHLGNLEWLSSDAFIRETPCYREHVWEYK